MITLEDSLQILKKDSNFREIIKDGEYYFNGEEYTFENISYDSRQVDEHTLFFAKGAQFKREYLLSAIESGLKYYVSEVDYEVGIPAIIVTNIKQAMSLIAMEFYNHPEKNLKILAFTGTKGKTTAAYFAYNILKQEHKPAMLSTMNTTLDGKTFFKSTLTTPESLDLFKMMQTALDNGMTHLIMEVSSQAYLVQRVYGLEFDAGVFLNISPDHIGPIEHPTFEDYFYHKRLLLENSRFVIINNEMEHAQVLREQVANQEAAFYGAGSENVITKSEAFQFDLAGSLEGTYEIQLIGRFNQENAIAAALACKQLGASKEAIKKGITETKVPGRMEVLKQSNGARVFVDYAHNGVSLDNLIKVVTEHQKGQVTLIIGAPGNKGESRRKDFGDVINQYPGINVILSADDPNFENPFAISQEIASHISRQVPIIVDREEAIKTALSSTQDENDAVIIAGKGADAFQIVEGKRAKYDGDLEVAKRYL